MTAAPSSRSQRASDSTVGVTDAVAVGDLEVLPYTGT
jgi:hypothetical protein